jgi:hypothetical protein
MVGPRRAGSDHSRKLVFAEALARDGRMSAPAGLLAERLEIALAVASGGAAQPEASSRRRPHANRAVVIGMIRRL